MRRDRREKVAYGEPVARRGEVRGAFAETVRSARTRAGLTLAQAADATGVSRATLIRWENGEITEPVLSQLKAFIAAMDVPAEDILRALELLPSERPTSVPVPARMTNEELLDEVGKRMNGALEQRARAALADLEAQKRRRRAG
ncbi:helix-turn-helix transcriptional regulator [Jiangella asiatica]|uniref:XRE family transcriptional regulator n=1 Tax=Jiangella asiatica TaxID=2530372 RepID=A0A4R5CZN3_9ACTN|nr:helix-turn-helix transcriptional regulator [Jiangella asiatica]TDE03425.1 XRE family transcriptional regulator [Jiangella asiatica]